MNGRVYDPSIARFISADPIIDGPENSQSYNRYSYVNNNPLTYTDPTGYWKIKIGPLKFGKSSDIRTLAAVGLGVLTYGAVSGAFAIQGTIYVGTTAVGTLTVPTLTGTVLGGAAAGFVSGVTLTGNLEGGLQGALAGGLGGAFFGSGVVGEMIGGGINGYLQTGDLRGFARGALSGLIPEDLGFARGYRDSPIANVSIGLVRDGLRGAVVGGRDGLLRGIGYGQLNNAVGHLVGLATADYKGFKGGAFYYDSEWWSSRGGAITIGNVISGPSGMYDPNSSADIRLIGKSLYGGWRTYLEALVPHELGHIPQSRYLGALYLPAHGTIMGLSRLITGNTHSWFNALENSLHAVPHDVIAPPYRLQ